MLPQFGAAAFNLVIGLAFFAIFAFDGFKFASEDGLLFGFGICNISNAVLQVS
jgi:hypothetical protein